MEGTVNSSCGVSDATVHRISIKVPPFWPQRPAIWFATLEAQFHLNQITQEITKFYFAIAQLDPQYSGEVEELITHPPSTNAYTQLKETLISRFSESSTEKARQLLEHEEIGDRKPSAFLRHLRRLANKGVDDNILRTIWLSRLPMQVQGILIGRGDVPLEELGDTADQLFDVYRSSTSHFQTHSVETSPNSTVNPQLQALQAQVAELTRVVASLTAEEVAETFVNGWISRFGVPVTVTTDQGRQFESTLFLRLLNTCAAKRVRTTSYHPQANGMIERLHRQLKAALMCHAETWSRSLPIVLLGIRTALKEDLNCSAAELVYGEPLRLPGEFVLSPADITDDVGDYVTRLRDKMAKLKPVPASHHSQNSTFVFKDLSTATHVFLRDDTVRRPLQPPYKGPYKVLSRNSKTLNLDLGGRTVKVSIDRTKPAYIQPEPGKDPWTQTRPAKPQIGLYQTPTFLSPALSPTSASRSTAPIPAPTPTSSSAPTTTTTPTTAPTTTPTPALTTRSGRRVRFRDILDL